MSETRTARWSTKLKLPRVGQTFEDKNGKRWKVVKREGDIVTAIPTYNTPSRYPELKVYR